MGLEALVIVGFGSQESDIRMCYLDALGEVACGAKE